MKCKSLRETETMDWTGQKNSKKEKKKAESLSDMAPRYQHSWKGGSGCF